MKKSKKILLLTASALVLLGIAVSVTAMALLKFDFKRLSTQEMVSKTIEIKQDFVNIEIEQDDCDIIIKPSQNGICSVEYTLESYKNPEIEVEDGTLKIEFEDEDFIHYVGGIYTDSNTVTVYLPENEYNELSVECTSGNITVEKGLVFLNADLESTSGDMKFSANVKNNLSVEATSGDLTFLNNSIEGNVDIVITSGDIRFDKFDAKSFNIKATSGNVSGNILTDKIFIVHTSSGTVNVPESSSGGLFKIITTSGDISLKISDK